MKNKLSIELLPTEEMNNKYDHYVSNFLLDIVITYYGTWKISGHEKQIKHFMKKNNLKMNDITIIEETNEN